MTLLGRMVDQEQREAAWREFVALYTKPVLGLIRHLSGINQADAEDLTQKVMIKVFRSLKDYRRDGRFRSWLRKIVRRCVIDCMRSQRADRATGHSDVAEQLAQVENRHSQVEDRHWEDDWRDRLFHLACDRVKERCQRLHWQVFCELCLEERSAVEIAASTGLNQAYVYVIRGRIYKQVKEEIQRLKAKWGEGDEL
jgi:RNA polymerase sigma factor (sigma-70 family)